MSNENCLNGFECPNCGHTESFQIEAKASFTVTDDGTDFPEHVQWENESPCACICCGYVGVVENFQRKERPTDESDQD
jgi:hypothetical protein